MPAWVNPAVVSGALAWANTTVPGPLALLQATLSAPGGSGRPSSVAVPARSADPGRATARSGPALAEGASFGPTLRGPRSGAVSSKRVPSFSSGNVLLSLLG